jgi:CRP/FNR family transcriptional regulator
MSTATVIRMDRISPKAGAAIHTACSACTLAPLCLPTGLGRPDLERMDGLVTRSAPLHEGDHLCRVGDPFEAVYAVRSGSFKTYTVDSEGREHVLGFHLPGELMGLKAIYPKHHIANTVALDTATVCVLPYSDLTKLAMDVPELQAQLLRLMSKDLAGAYTMAGDFTAEERLAAFLIGLSRRYAERGFAAQEFNLTMSRRDIANYLRLAPETVSRVLARFEKDQLISVDRRAVSLLDAGTLHDMARCVEDMQL